MNPFITPNKILENNGKYRIKTDKLSGDGFFIDKKYQGKLGSNVPAKKLTYAFVGVVLIILILFSRVFYLQIVKNKEYRLMAEGNRIKTEFLPAARGIFFDRNNNILVANNPKFSLFIEQGTLSQPDLNQTELVKKISELTFLPQQKILDQLGDEAREENNSQDILINGEVGYQPAMLLQANPEKYPHLKLQLTPERRYDNTHDLSHVLGYLGKINEQDWQTLKYSDYQFFDAIGKSGLEKEYEKILRGQPGKIEREVDAQGNIIETLNYQQPLPGKNLVLTIDQALNQKLSQVLTEQINNINRTQAAGVALNPKTGEILALVSLPTFDNNIFSNSQKFAAEIDQILNDKNQPLFNRVISGEYPSGSTFKLMLGAAALQEKIITEWTQILSTGGIQISEWFYPDWQSGGHGLTNITRALAESINTFFYYIGGGYQDFEGLGLEKIISYAYKFNLGKILGIDLPNEAAGFLPTREWKEKTKNEQWYIGDTYHLSIGQGDILVTPLQIASLTATIANGGSVFKPYLVKEIIDVDKNKSTLIQPQVINQDFIDEKNIKIIQKGLRQAVLTGSAKSLNDLPFSSAAKTGTAQVGGEQDSHAWFTVFAPYEDPEIVLTILIENGGEGSVTALPVAKEVLKWYFGVYPPSPNQP